MTNRYIFVGPAPAPELTEAVLRAGGTPAPAAECSAMIWYGGSTDRFRELIHPGVRWVQLPNAGVESWLDIVPGGPVFTSAAGAYANTVAEHALALMLAAARRLHDLARARTWTAPDPVTLRDASVLLIGAGGIGESLIGMLAPLGADIVAVTRTGRAVAGARLSVAADALPDVLGDADYVVLAAPATPQTRAMISGPELARMKPSAWLVNVGRGNLVDTSALLSALQTGSLGGAALDVTDPEPLPDGHPLWDEPRVLITPHSANSERLLLRDLAVRVEQNTRRFLAAQPLLAVVDPVRGY